MRTKILLLTAALSAAGLATSMAQTVYSVNAVGYVNLTLKAETANLIGNPLNGSNNLFRTVLNLPNDAIGTTVFRWINANQGLSDANTYLGDGNWIAPDGSEPAPLNPGEGFYIVPTLGSGSPTLTVTFVGEVPQGTLTTPLAGPNLFSMKSSPVPQSAPPGGPGIAATLELVGRAGDIIYLFDPNLPTPFSEAYTRLDDAGTMWLDPAGNVNLGPTIEVGHGWFNLQSNDATGPTSWTRTFSVN